MSDLRRAVQADIDAFAPAAAPPFDALLARKRSRDRRRAAAVGVLSAVAVVGVAGAVAAAAGSGQDRLPGYAGGPAAGSETAYGLTYHPKAYDRDRVEAALTRCSSLPGAARGGQARSFPPGDTVFFDGSPEQQRDVEQCLRQVPSATVVERDTGRRITPERPQGCVGTVTATALGGGRVVIKPEVQPTLAAAVGDRVSVAGDGSCGDAVRASNGQPPPGLVLDGPVVVATRPGRYLVQVTHSACDGQPDPTCRGGLAFDGVFVLDASG